MLKHSLNRFRRIVGKRRNQSQAWTRIGGDGDMVVGPYFGLPTILRPVLASFMDINAQKVWVKAQIKNTINFQIVLLFKK